MFMNNDYNISSRSELSYKGRRSFLIGHENKSCTETPTFYPINDVYFVDCPGIADQNEQKEYTN